MDSDDRLSLVICAIDMHFAGKDVERAVRLLLSVRASILAKYGCRGCDVGMEVSEPGLVHYREEWEPGGAFHQHVRSEEFRRVLIAMDLCSEEPRIVVGNLSGQAGMAYLRKLLSEVGEPPIADNGSATIVGMEK
jgi:quinol monooxygenase YgiN